VWLLNNNTILKSDLLIQLMYIYDILFKIISIGSCTPLCKKNLSGLEAFSEVISQGRRFKLLCRLSIHLTQPIEGFGGSFLHFHTKLMLPVAQFLKSNFIATSSKKQSMKRNI